MSCRRPTKTSHTSSTMSTSLRSHQSSANPRSKLHGYVTPTWTSTTRPLMALDLIAQSRNSDLPWTTSSGLATSASATPTPKARALENSSSILYHSNAIMALMRVRPCQCRRSTASCFEKSRRCSGWSKKRKSSHRHSGFHFIYSLDQHQPSSYVPHIPRPLFPFWAPLFSCR